MKAISVKGVPFKVTDGLFNVLFSRKQLNNELNPKEIQ
jgi:hypothetical protein